MSDHTGIAPSTIRAYEDSDFHIAADPPFVMHPDQQCAQLAALYDSTSTISTTSCAYISACNPNGETADATKNAGRQEALINTLETRGLPYLRGAAEDPRGKYPPEPGCLILGISRDDAIAIGGQLQQNAILFASADATPRLVLLR